MAPRSVHKHASRSRFKVKHRPQEAIAHIFATMIAFDTHSPRQRRSPRRIYTLFAKEIAFGTRLPRQRRTPARRDGGGPQGHVYVYLQMTWPLVRTRRGSGVPQPAARAGDPSRDATHLQMKLHLTRTRRASGVPPPAATAADPSRDATRRQMTSPLPRTRRASGGPQPRSVFRRATMQLKSEP